MTFLVIVAHPDDEILGCYGTIAWAISHGHSVAIEILAASSKTRENGLITTAKAIHNDIGISKSVFHEYETMKFGTYDRYEMTAEIETTIKAVRPDVIFTHDRNDIHNDHRILAEVVLEASKLPLRCTGYEKPIKAIYSIEVPSSTDWGAGFIPNAFFEVSEEALAKKEEYLKEYFEVIREIPHPRNEESFKALARYRGGQCGCRYAEAFRKIYEVNV